MTNSVNYSARKDKAYQYYSNSNWKGAVNFILVQDSIFLIRRSHTMPTHAGQVAFVGGHKTKDEDHPLITAKREFEEETGLNSDKLLDSVLLDPVSTTNSSVIIPVFSRVDMEKEEFLSSIKSNGEWDASFLVKADYVFNSFHWSVGKMHRDKSYDVFFCPITRNYSMSLDSNDYPVVLWGATARIIWNFFKIHIDDVKKP